MKTERYILADLRLDTALHIGTGKGGDPADSPLRRAGNGRLMIPGRSLGGALRTIATRLAPRLGLGCCWALLTKKQADEIQEREKRKICGCTVCQLFGEINPNEDDAEETGGAASRLWISDAFVKGTLYPKDDPRTHIRDGVGIARAQRVAARNVKYDFEIVPPDAVFELRLKLVDDDSNAAKTREKLFAAALAEWQAGRGRLGGNAARGLGRFTLAIRGQNELLLDTPTRLIDYLKSPKPWELASCPNTTWWDSALEEANRLERQSAVGEAARGFVAVEFQIGIEGPFLINDPLVAALAGFDHAPLLQVAANAAGAPVLSGSSLRGAMRTRAEKIARTLAMLEWKEKFLDHCPACDPLVNQPDKPLANCDRRIQIKDSEETPERALCLACQLFGSPRRGSRLWIEDALWAGDALNQNAWHAQDFLAIDRFTGGGRDGAKFDAAPLTNARFNARLTLHDPKDWELGWLVLVLRDLCDGEMTLGFGAAKGYGRARARDFQWTLGWITQDDLPDGATLLAEGTPSGVFRLTKISAGKGMLPTARGQTAQKWVTAFQNEAEKFNPGDMTRPIQKDTFFGTDGKFELYGLPRVEKEQYG